MRKMDDELKIVDDRVHDSTAPRRPARALAIEITKWLVIVFLLTLIAVGTLQQSSSFNKLAATTQQQLNKMSEISKKEASTKVLLATLPDGLPIWGVTSLDGEVYVLRQHSSELEVYDTLSYTLRRRLPIPGLRTGNDLVASARWGCLYIADITNNTVHRVDVRNGDGSGGQQISSWSSRDKPSSLSVNPTTSNVLVTSGDVNKIKEFTTDGTFVREVAAPPDVANLTHAADAGGDALVVAYGSYSADSSNRVCLAGYDGMLRGCYGGKRGAAPAQIGWPIRVAVHNGSIIVDDLSNDHIFLLSPDLRYVRDLVSRYEGLRAPSRMWFDDENRKLYVADNELKDDRVVAGNVKVFSVNLD